MRLWVKYAAEAAKSCLPRGGEGPLIRAVEPPFHFDWSGRWSYALVLLPYFLMLGGFMWHYRILFKFRSWQFFLQAACAAFFVLGLGFEWVAQMFYAWTFPEQRFLAQLEIPFFGWFTHNAVPYEELLWILLVIPLFYYLFLWATLVFYDVIYVVDEQGRFHKREERWVGFFGDTHIKIRKKGKRGREHETSLKRRKPGFVAKIARHLRKSNETPSTDLAE